MHHWANDTKKRHIYIPITSYQQLNEIISDQIKHTITSVKTTELIQRLIIDANSNQQTIIFDNVHLLSKSEYNILLETLNNCFGHTAILISDINLDVSRFNTIKKIIISELKLLEVTQYQQAFHQRFKTNSGNNKYNVEKLLYLTDGIPSALNHFLVSHHQEFNFYVGFLNDLSQNELQTLHLIAFFPTIVTRVILQIILPDTSFDTLDQSLKKLLEYYLIEEKNNKISMLNIVKKSLTSSLRTQAKKLILKSILVYLKGQNSSFTLTLIILFQLADIEEINQYFLKSHHVYKLDFMSDLNINDLEKIINLTDDILQQVKIDPIVKIDIIRILAQANYLKGKRETSLKILIQNLYLLETIDKNHLSRQYFFYNLIKYYNYANNFHKSIQHLNNLDYKNLKLKYHFRLEYLVAKSGIETDEKTNRLDYYLNQFENLRHEIMKNSCNSRLHAYCLFQNARVFSKAYNYSQSIHFYDLAYNEFKNLEMPYQVAMALINKIWTALKINKFENIKIDLDSLSLLVDKYNYIYLRHGVLLLKAKVARQQLQYKKGLFHIEESAKCLKQMPPNVVKDILQEKITLLFLNYNINAAKIAYEDLKTLCLSQNLSYSKEIDLLLRSDDGNIEELNDLWQDFNFKHSNVFVSNYLLERNIIFNKSKFFKKNSRHDQISLIIYNLLLNIKNENRWQFLGQLESAISRLETWSFYHFVFHITDMLFSSSKITSDKIKLLHQQLELWSADKNFTQLLYVIISHIKNDRFKDIKKTDEWKKSSKSFQIFWAQFHIFHIDPKNTCQKDEIYPAITIQKVAHILENNNLVIFESHAEVYLNSSIIKEFSTHKNLLSFLIQLIKGNHQFISKENLTAMVWGEIYNPTIHASRIYTSIRRIRTFLKQDNVIQNSLNGYRINPQFSVHYSPAPQDLVTTDQKSTTLITSTLGQCFKRGIPWVSRSYLVNATGISESKLKRVLSQLYSSQVIFRKGEGRGVKYSCIG